jgi:DNA-directed RNA polymerase subunit RPC12/RpoP
MINTRWDRMEATKPKGPHGWIQWKGTNVCMDVYCSCGKHGHIDQDFTYHYKCLACGKLFDIAGYVRLIEVPEEEITANDREGRTVAVDELLQDELNAADYIH